MIIIGSLLKDEKQLNKFAFDGMIIDFDAE
jgi:hypothetical protein